MREHREDPLVRAQLTFLGQSLVEGAMRRLPLFIKRHAILWKTAPALKQLAIARNLVRKLHKTGAKPPSSLEDFRNQGNGRVLPREYSVRDGQVKPNCLGKAQLVCAFARLAGAEVYALNPIIGSDRYFVIEHGKLQLDMGKLLRDQHQFRGLRFIGGLITTGAKNIRWGEQPIRLHGVMVIRLCDGRWAYIDPNYKKAFILSNQKYVEDAISCLKRLNRDLPGLSLLLQFSEVQEAVDKHRKKFEILSEICRELAHLKRSRRLTLARAVKVLTSPAYEQLATELLVVNREGSSSPEERFHSYVQQQTEAMVAKKRKGCKTVSRAKATWLQLLPSILCSQLDRQTATNIQGGNFPSLWAEIQDPEQFLAASVMAHLAYNERCSLEVEEVLAEHVFNQYRLFYRCLPWCTGRRKRRNARADRAEAVLRSLPGRLQSVDKVLGLVPRNSEQLQEMSQWLRSKKALEKVKATRKRAREHRHYLSQRLPIRHRRPQGRRFRRQ